MGLWQVNADTLAGSRFVVSALAETTAGLFSLQAGTAAHPGERAWLDAHRPAFTERLAADPVTALLSRTVRGHRWIADFLTPTPHGDSKSEPDLDEELRPVRETSAEAAHQHLRDALEGPLPAALHRSDLPERAADLLHWVWTETIRPYWPRRRRIIEADIIARTGQLSQGGWAAALDGLRPGMRWLGQSRLQINAQDNPLREISGARLLFIPVTHRHGWVSWDASGAGSVRHRYAVVYPCSGTLAEAGRKTVPQPLGRLLGPARAAVLVLLDTPKSTTHLVALTGQALGSVGRHLRILRDAGLAGRRRSGRSVLYYRTPAGEVLVRASTNR